MTCLPKLCTRGGSRIRETTLKAAQADNAFYRDIENSISNNLAILNNSTPSQCDYSQWLCTAASQIGLMICQFTRWLRGIAVEKDLALNLLAGEMAVG